MYYVPFDSKCGEKLLMWETTESRRGFLKLTFSLRILIVLFMVCVFLDIIIIIIFLWSLGLFMCVRATRNGLLESLGNQSILVLHVDAL